MITYNHEKFIVQAIDSVLTQDVNFPLELVIGDDCSTDRTRDIVRSYAAQHPHLISLLLPERNIGVHENLRRVLHACQGRYIALLEGDDFWIDQRKLQMQVDLLDQAPEASFCFHATEIRYEDDPSQNHLWRHEPTVDVTVEQLLQRWFAMTQSILLRRDRLFPLPDWGEEVWNLDWMLQLILAARGSICYLDEVMAVYRKHAGGWSNTFNYDARERGAIALFRKFNAWSVGRYGKTVRPLIANRYLLLATRCRAAHKYPSFAVNAAQCIRFALPSRPLKFLNLLRLLLLPPGFNSWMARTRLFQMARAAFPATRLTPR